MQADKFLSSLSTDAVKVCMVQINDKYEVCEHNAQISILDTAESQQHRNIFKYCYPTRPCICFVA